MEGDAGVDWAAGGGAGARGAVDVGGWTLYAVSAAGFCVGAACGWGIGVGKDRLYARIRNGECGFGGHCDSWGGRTWGSAAYDEGSDCDRGAGGDGAANDRQPGDQAN